MMLLIRTAILQTSIAGSTVISLDIGKSSEVLHELHHDLPSTQKVTRSG
ncbi:MAG TPA: hypothetical protein V6C64_16835 [Microcoleaceae cyanobacterium]|jgi:hypothetical protein